MTTPKGLRGAGSGEEARRHLAAGRAIYVSDPNWPGRAVRVHPDGRRELMRLDLEKGELVVDRELPPDAS
ncbi:MAG: hypothetical protein ACREXQ_01705 [Polaromonas sp.]